MADPRKPLLGDGTRSSGATLRGMRIVIKVETPAAVAAEVFAGIELHSAFQRGAWDVGVPTERCQWLLQPRTDVLSSGESSS